MPLQVIERNISDLIPAEYNPRYITDDAFEQLKASIKRFDTLEPIIVNTHPERKNIIISGHQRVKAARDLGLETFPAVEVSLTRDEERELNVRMNKNTGDWDWDELANHFSGEELEDWGFTDEELFGDGAFDDPEAEEDDFEVPDEDEIETDIKEGDLIEIGRHRLLCGDSTNKEQVEYLVDRSIVDCVFTDPPYDFEDYSWTDYVFEITDGHIFILNSEQRLVDISVKHKEELSRWYAVDFRKGHLISNKVPITRVDFIAEFRTSERVKYRNLKKNFMTLIECLKESSNSEDHKQAKNPELPARFIEHHTVKDENVLDLFLGSGTTMVAAHQLDRTCYGMELDPKYCQVIVDRMLKLGPTLEVKVNGEPYKKAA